MAEHTLYRNTIIDRPRAEVFDFFADAGNLEVITPPQLNFHIITPQPIRIGKGTLIDYRLKLRGLPVNWRTEISHWDPPFSFVDRQLRGPYTQWIHTHRFTEISPGRTMMEDEVKYRLPMEPLGDIFHFLIARELDHIFNYRQETIRGLFETSSKAA